MAHSRVNANVNIAINSLLAQQESMLRFTMPLEELSHEIDETKEYSELDLENGAEIADLLNSVISKMRAQQPDVLQDDAYDQELSLIHI